MTALALAEHHEPPAPVATSPIVGLIERAIGNPNTSIDTLERLLKMQTEVAARAAEAEYAAAMSDAQAELSPVAADANNPQTKSKYASYAALDRAVRPVYTKNGFALSFNTGADAPPEHVRVLCKVTHRAGHSETHHVDMPADGKGAKGGDVMTKTHAAGAAMSYGQRYLLKLIFNIAVGDDNDGNGAPRGQSAVVAAAIAGLNGVPGTTEALRTWKRDNDTALKAMTADEQGAVIRAFNDRWSKRTEAQR